MNSNNDFIKRVNTLLKAYNDGLLGDTAMPEESHPIFNTQEEKLLYFTLPMALNYQRNSYKLWEAALKTWEDTETKAVFNMETASQLNTEILRNYLLKYKLALQPNKHIDTWNRISKTINENWGSIALLLESTDYDFLKLKEIVQNKYKKSFPYLSGPKIFNYWAYIIQEYADIKLKNREYIEIAPDTHVIQASIKLGVISNEEANKISREDISLRWRNSLKGSGIDPIDVHSPLWFWSRSGFKLKI